MRRVSAFLLAAAALLAAGSAAAQSPPLQVISSRPELVSGGSALVRAMGGAEAPVVSIDGGAAVPLFADGKGGWLGMVGGLALGENRIVARPAGGGATAEIRVTNHGAGAALFSGPAAAPFACANDAHGLGVPADAACTAPRVTEYYYRSTSGDWARLPATATRPSDVAETTTSDGRKAPLIVRVDRGVANRAAFAIAVLDDPGRPIRAPWDLGGSGWNGRLIYSFGGGVGYGGHDMGSAIGFLDPAAGYVGGDNAGLYETLIGDGYAIVGASLNVTAATANDIVQAETVVRVKEQFAKLYGPPDLTIAVGKDGGALPLYLIAQNYPGLLDGIFAIGGYADPVQYQTAVNDCALLAHYFATTKILWSPAQQHDVAGETTMCATYPAGGPAGCAVGAACTFEENLAAAFARDAATGRARAPWDNVGVQYGLKPFYAGLISEDQFVNLNAAIGGRTPDGGFQTARNAGDPAAIRAAYATGRILGGADGLTSSAIVNIRLYPPSTCGDPPCPREAADTAAAEGDRTDSIRARLEYAALSPGNYAEIVISDDRAARGPAGFTSQVLRTALAYLDVWLTEAAAHPSSGTWPERIITYRPPPLRDTCLTRGSSITNGRTCDQLFPPAIGVRGAAGAPASDDIVKCQLKPSAASDYSPLASPDLLPRLRAIFPDGVCNYDLPGVGQVPLTGTWLTYAGDGTVAASGAR